MRRFARPSRPLVVAALRSPVGAGRRRRPTPASSHALIQGSGSSWSANAINQWIADVTSNGLQVVYTPNGSAQGRKDFAYKTTDFAVTEIGYQGLDPATGAQRHLARPRRTPTCPSSPAARRSPTRSGSAAS